MELKIEYLPIEALEAYAKNTRKHADKDINQIAKSIEKFGFSDPIGIWSDHNVIVEGHGRLAAAKRLGMETVPCIRLDHMTDEQRREYGIAHNATAELSEWDIEMLNTELASLDMTDFEFNFKIPDPAEQEDDLDIVDDTIPELPPEPTSKRGQIYQLGDHRLMVGDSTNQSDVDKLMNGVTADLLFTDPPYNINVKNSQGMTIENDNMDNAAFREFLDGAFSCAAAAIKPGAPFYVWHADGETINFRQSCDEHGLMVKQTLIWVKNSFTFGRQDYKWKHEPCLYGWKEGAGHYFVEEYNHPTAIEQEIDLEKMKKEDMKQLLQELLTELGEMHTSVIHEDKPTKNDLHPTMKPLRMCASLIHNSSRKGAVVLDLFGGSGSTLIVCQQMSRTCYMMEYDPKYADVIIQRWEKLTGEKAQLITE